MAEITVAALTSPVSDSAPCGVDLDIEGDPDFLNFFARAEGLLPASYFSGPEGRPFDRSAIDLKAELSAAQPLLERTRDIRLLVLLAKFSVLNRDLKSFVTCVGAIAQLLESRWEEVHPRGEEGNFAIRSAVIETLNDSAPVVIPLQYMPLIESRRFGAISYRNVMFANGEATPREGEETIDQGNIDRALTEVDLPILIDRRSTFDSLRTAFGTIQKRCRDKAGADQAVSLEKPIALVDKIFIFLNDAIAKRDPGAAVAAPVALAETAGAAGTPAPAVVVAAIRSNAEAAAALAAVDGYFCRCEPSNPALLLVRQVRQLVGKSLLEVLQILIPGQLGEAKFRLGGNQPLEIPVESLAAVAAIEPPPAEVSEAPAAEVSEASAAEAGTGGSPVQPDPPKANNRQEAFAVLEQVAAYYRITEPSSPISLILDRARSFANRDFLAVLKDLLAKPAS
jgi:type VI secretion system protein ImpA